MRMVAVVVLLLLAGNAGFAAGSAPDEVFICSENGEPDPARPLYREARLLMLRHNWIEAAAKYESLISAYPESTLVDDARFYLGYCSEMLGRKHQAFSHYSQLLSEFPQSPRCTQAMPRAVELAQELRRVAGDRYDTFITRFVREQIHHAYRIDSAIRMAQFGDWRGLELLLSGLTGGTEIQKIMISQLLRQKVDDPRVSEALSTSLMTDHNVVVRMTAASALARVSSASRVRESLRTAMLQDASPAVRVSAAAALVRHADQVDVAPSFETFIRNETDPVALTQTIDMLDVEDFQVDFSDTIIIRLESEEDPEIKAALIGGIDGSDFVVERKEVIDSLLRNPEPAVRMRTINLLAPRSDEPEVRIEIVRTLENDSNVSVQITAVTALSHMVVDEQVRHAFLVTVDNTDNPQLASTTIGALGKVVMYPDVRSHLATLLVEPQLPQVHAQIVFSLEPVMEAPEVQDAFIVFFESSSNPLVKLMAARRLPRIVGRQRLQRLRHIYETERSDGRQELAQQYRILLTRSEAQSVSEPEGQDR